MSDDDEPVVERSADQRAARPGEPTCVVCGRFGAYICDETDRDVCSLECKARHLAGRSAQAPPPLQLPPAAPPPAVPSPAEVRARHDIRVQGTPTEHRTHHRAWPCANIHLQRAPAYGATGPDVPPPAVDFGQLRLPAVVAANLRDGGVERPTPIQMQLLPAMAAGRDVLAAAGTGAGKTLAYALGVALHTAKHSGDLSQTVRAGRRKNARIHLFVAVSYGGATPAPAFACTVAGTCRSRAGAHA